MELYAHIYMHCDVFVPIISSPLDTVSICLLRFQVRWNEITAYIGELETDLKLPYFSYHNEIKQRQGYSKMSLRKRK